MHQRPENNMIRILNLFSAQDEELDGVEWAALTEATLCAEPVYERFAAYLLHTYKIEPGSKNAGKPLDGGSVGNYLGSAINLAADRFRAVGADSSKLFFVFLDTKSTSGDAKWLRGPLLENSDLFCGSDRS